jgi:hypothetical protein
MDFVKIVFRLPVEEDGFPPIASEALNARRDAEGFVLENTPFFATGVSLGDRVEGTPDQGVSDRFTFSQVIESSTNRAISIIFLDSGVKENVYQELKLRGCYCEYGEFGKDGQLQMLAVSVPESCDYESVARYLSEHEAGGRLSYAELAV